jgi:hypothetical protein
MNNLDAFNEKPTIYTRNYPRNMHLSVFYTLVLSLRLMTISALPTAVPPPSAAEPQHVLPESYICCPDEVEPNPDVIPLGCRLCTADDPAPPSAVQIKNSFSRRLPLLSEGGEVKGGEVERAEIEEAEAEGGEIEGVFHFAGRAENGLANWKLNWKERKVEQLTLQDHQGPQARSGIEQLQMEARRMHALSEMAEGGGNGGDEGEGEAMLGK